MGIHHQPKVFFAGSAVPVASDPVAPGPVAAGAGPAGGFAGGARNRIGAAGFSSLSMLPMIE